VTPWILSGGSILRRPSNATTAGLTSVPDPPGRREPAPIRTGTSVPEARNPLESGT